VNHCYDSRSPPFMLYATRKLRFSRWKQKIACKRDVVCMRSLVQLSFFLIRSFSIPRTRTESKVLVHHPDFSRVSAFRYPHPLAFSLPHLPLFLLHLLPASRLAPAQALWLLNNVVVEDKSEMNTLACQRARVHALPMAWNERTLRHRIARGRSWTKAIWHAADDGHDIHDCPATRARSYPLFLFIAEYTFIYHSANATFWGFIRRPLKKIPATKTEFWSNDRCQRSCTAYHPPAYIRWHLARPDVEIYWAETSWLNRWCYVRLPALVLSFCCTADRWLSRM